MPKYLDRAAIVKLEEGAEPLPWLLYTAERKRLLKSGWLTCAAFCGFNTDT